MRFVLITLATLTACLDHEPGTSMGTYAVTGTLKTQTCGSDLGANTIDPWSFDVRLSRSGAILFWLQDSSPPLSGSIDPNGYVTINTSELFPIQSADGGGPYCAVVRSDAFNAALGTAAIPSGFTGKIAYHYDLDPGSSCGGLLAGQFDTLPCDVSYDISAKK